MPRSKVEAFARRAFTSAPTESRPNWIRASNGALQPAESVHCVPGPTPRRLAGVVGSMRIESASQTRPTSTVGSPSSLSGPLAGLKTGGVDGECGAGAGAHDASATSASAGTA